MVSKGKIIILAVGAAVALSAALGGAVYAGFLPGAGASDTLGLTIDYDEPAGTIRPLNGINNGPASRAVQAEDGSWSFDFDVTGYYKSMNVSMVRLHDTEYPFGGGRFVDIHCIFPDFSADADDPESYYFDATDAYIARIIQAGGKVMFRLGESIDHTGENTYINPPEDYDKWAQICEHIVRHYNESWADGYRYDIKYWEIWNEPDNSHMWTGTMAEYCRLYAATARYLKDTHPEIYVGGPALAGIKEDTMREFLDGIKAYGDVPMDFFSWHDYNSSPTAFAAHADKAREILDEYGYTDTQSVLDEWNYIEDWNDQTSSIEFRRSARGGAYIAAALIAMQEHSVDLAMYYDGQYELVYWYCGLYGQDGQTHPGYYSYKYWGELARMGTQVSAEYEEYKDIWAIAAKSRSGLRAVLIANFNDTARKIKLDVADAGHLELLDVRRVNEQYPDEKESSELMLRGKKIITLQPGEVIFITF